MRRRYVLTVAVLGAAVVLPAVASSGTETTPSIEAVNTGGGLYGEHHYWLPAQATIAPGGAVLLSNKSEVAHGVEWRGALKPTCEEGAGKVPVGTTPAASATKWSGACKFTQAGTYTFYCTVHGPEMTGTITVAAPGPPSASTGAPSAVGQTEATLNGTVNPDGEATKYFFEWGTDTSYGQTTTELPLSGEDHTGHAVSAKLTGLAPATPYHYRLVAKNASGTVPGVDQVLTTEAPPGAPFATTDPAGELGEAEATLNGTINPGGQATEYFFEWGTSAKYGQTTAKVPLSAEDHTGHSVSIRLTGLAADTEYHFRVLATNASEVTPVPGADQVFKTNLTPEPMPEPTPEPTPQPTPTPTQPTPGLTPPLPTPIAPSAEPPSGSPLAGGPSLRSTQHGASVGGVLEVSAAGAGGRLEVDLLAKGASLAGAKRSAAVRVGHLARGSLSAGRVAFVVQLDAQARRALKRLRHLALSVRITLTPAHGRAVVLTRAVVLRQ